MVPEGLILLTSVAFTVGVLRLARRRTLVQELPAIEVLARVDVICLDKTGTITSGAMDVGGVDPVDGADSRTEVEQALAAISWSDPNPNATQHALQARFPDDPGWTQTGTVAFSSARKWSAASFTDRGTWVLGAPEMVAGDGLTAIEQHVSAAADEGQRVLLLARTDEALSGDDLPAGVRPAALVRLEDQVRPDAHETLA